MKHTLSITKTEYLKIINDPKNWELRRYCIGYYVNDTIRFKVVDKLENEFIVPRMFLITNILKTRVQPLNHDFCIISIAELDYSKNITM